MQAIWQKSEYKALGGWLFIFECFLSLFFQLSLSLRFFNRVQHIVKETTIAA
jgi:hypothetical protein